MEGNCDIWADVDFGHGPVEVRCTEIDEHDVHICEVYLDVDTSVKQVKHASSNVFDEKKSLETGNVVRMKRRY